MPPIRIRPGDRIALPLTPTERRQVLAGLVYLPEELEDELRITPPDKDLQLTLDDLDELADCIASAANHEQDRRLRKAFEAIFLRIYDLLGQYSDEDEPETHAIGPARTKAAITKHAVKLAEWAAKVLAGSRSRRELRGPTRQTIAVQGLRLSKEDLAVLADKASLGAELVGRLRRPRKQPSIEDACALCLAIAEALPDAEPADQVLLLMVADRVTACLQRTISQAPATPHPRPSRRRTSTVYQFKITLQDIDPPIWRRFQTNNGTLEELHRHLQAVMGWENYHLYDFEINGRRYIEPDPDGDFADMEVDTLDPRDYALSDLLPAEGKRATMVYRYDFGDGWRHQLVFEGCPKAAHGQRYPYCLEGQRACPPEDIGGVYGYLDYLQAIRDPDHPRHAEYLQWRGPFDSEAFDVEAVNRQLQGRP